MSEEDEDNNKVAFFKDKIDDFDNGIVTVPNNYFLKKEPEILEICKNNKEVLLVAGTVLNQVDGDIPNAENVNGYFDFEKNGTEDY